MHKNAIKALKATRIHKIPALLRILLKDEAIGGKLILGAAVLALVVANSPLRQTYEALWQYDLSVGFNQYVISLDLRHWVSEGLMAIFFLVVGLEIKREIVNGELRNPRTALLPIGAAIGGMVVPALFFLIFNFDQPESIRGWAIPIATDIAFALGVMSLLGRRVSSSLKIFLLTLAIVDDIGAIIIIALFYGSGFEPVYLAAALLIALGILLINSFRGMTLPIFLVLGVALWVAIFQSGVHASIAGAILGLLAPLTLYRNSSVAARLERLTIPVSTFVVVPLFAFASLGIVLTTGNINSGAYPLMGGIVAGLVLGKVVGITFASWLLIKLRLSQLPARTNWYQLTGVGFIAGIGFTVSVFISELAFSTDSELVNVAKISILVASTISAVSGYLFLRHKRSVEALLDLDSSR